MGDEMPERTRIARGRGTRRRLLDLLDAMLTPGGAP
jgi:hypothetical protein